MIARQRSSPTGTSYQGCGSDPARELDPVERGDQAPQFGGIEVQGRRAEVHPSQDLHLHVSDGGDHLTGSGASDGGRQDACGDGRLLERGSLSDLRELRIRRVARPA